MSTAGQLRIVLVTPETTLLDEPALSLRLPLYDGQIGILPGRTPLIGRLGYGELRIRTSAGERSYYVDGGFLQVKGSVVSVLTNRAVPRDAIKAADAQEMLQSALARVPTTDQDFAAKTRDQERARRMLQMTRS